MTQTFNENVLVDGSQDVQQLRVQGHTAQTEALQTWEDSTGMVQAQVAADGSFQVGSDSNVLAQLTGDGRLQVGDDLGLATPDALIEAHRDANSTPPLPKRGIHSLGRITTLITDLVAWMVAELELLGAAGVASLQTAFRAKVTHNNTGSSTTADIRAGDFEAVNQASNGQVGRMTAVHATVTNQSGAMLEEAIGLRVSINDIATGIEKPYAIYAEGPGIAHFEDALELQVLTATPPTPSENHIRIYPKSDGKLWVKDWANPEYLLGSGAEPVSGVPTGVTLPFAGSIIPDGWLWCDGKAISRTTYSGLHDLIGDVYAANTVLTTRTSDSQGSLTFVDANHNLSSGSATLTLRFYRAAVISSVNTSNDQITMASVHTFSTTDRVRFITTETLPGGLSAGTDYYIHVVSATVITVHLTASDATSNSNKVNITSAGSGTHTVIGQVESSRSGMAIQSTTDNIVTISGGTGDVLPPTNNNILVSCESNQFFLPDMRGRVAVGAGQGSGLTNRILGQPVGAEAVALSINEMPRHRHGGFTGLTSGSTFSYATYPASNSSTSVTDYQGNGQAHNNIQPSLILNYIIKT